MSTQSVHLHWFECCPCLLQRAGPPQAAGGGGGHRGLAEGSGLLWPAEGGGGGPVLHQRGRCERLCPARGAQLPRPAGELSPH